ncbi:Sorting nexin, cytoplasm-to-vacuole targeting pathway/endosomal sorting [Batrachochytrium dendrobatidis]|nr:Sorting nexin, cytoplasm-to-vacuole targeting pathway/endosomal sorting [Batrachochytrium dendrobatidis]KAK5670860.1 Sorting nexin, cytoplasm-to-vacuole targeting pathway/endosomal sorting [Batrachochytrium dendrobatidis]
MNSHPISQDDLEDGLSPVDGSTTHENDPTQLDIGSSTSKNPNVTSAVFSLVSYPEADQLLAESHMPSVDREKTTFCCEIDSAFTKTLTQQFLPPIQNDIPLRDQPKPLIDITEAIKAHDMAGSSYISYVIRTSLPDYSIDVEAKHRYSEFESLRKLLSKAYPTSVIPPIPGKHTVAAYAAKPGKAKEDPNIILLRKRMLQTFLNRVAAHPILGSAHVFHLFLREAAPWSETLTSSGMSHLLKRKDTLLAVNEKTTLRKPDAHFVAAEDYTIRFMSQIVYIEKIHKRIIAHHIDMATTYAELGGLYNGWSLTESTLADMIEQTGQAIDSTVTATNVLHHQLQERFGEILHEYALFSINIEKLLKWRHRKHAEFEGISESLILKQAGLVRLEQAEHESLRLAAALNSEGGYFNGDTNESSEATGPIVNENIPAIGTADAAEAGYTTTTSTTTLSNMHLRSGQSTSSPHLSQQQMSITGTSIANNPYRSGAYAHSTSTTLQASNSLLATLNSLMDNDPQVTRRNQISKTRDMIVQLETQRETARQELLSANAEIQHDLDRFQRQKIRDMRDMLCGLAAAQKEFHSRTLNAWRGIKESAFSIE